MQMWNMASIDDDDDDHDDGGIASAHISGVNQPNGFS